MRPIEPIAIEDIRSARKRIADAILRTPLVPLAADVPGGEIWLKLENLQPIGSFKLRGAGNAMRRAAPESLRKGGLHRERGQHGAGRGLERAAAGRSLHGDRPGARARRPSSPPSSGSADRS